MSHRRRPSPEPRLHDRGARHTAPPATDYPFKSRQFNAVDRKETCPFLVKIYLNTDRTVSGAELERLGLSPKHDVDIHTWKDATLREIATLLGDTQPTAKDRGTAITFQMIIENNPSQKIKLVPLGMVYNDRRSADDARTLEMLRFMPGDSLMVTILSDAVSDKGPGKENAGKEDGGKEKAVVVTERAASRPPTSIVGAAAASSSDRAERAGSHDGMHPDRRAMNGTGGGKSPRQAPYSRPPRG
ncbi:hypothetical protein HKX48_000789 [Thoreauomyces humboldtii]|nr:hypothetical protein HKX48_000789 [Thoreauomyces humboldtii]